MLTDAKPDDERHAAADSERSEVDRLPRGQWGPTADYGGQDNEEDAAQVDEADRGCATRRDRLGRGLARTRCRRAAWRSTPVGAEASASTSTTSGSMTVTVVGERAPQAKVRSKVSPVGRSSGTSALAAARVRTVVDPAVTGDAVLVEVAGEGQDHARRCGQGAGDADGEHVESGFRFDLPPDPLPGTDTGGVGAGGVFDDQALDAAGGQDIEPVTG